MLIAHAENINIYLARHENQPGFESIVENQATHIKQMIVKVRGIAAPEASRLVEVITAGPWPAALRTELCSAIDSKITANSGGGNEYPKLEANWNAYLPVGMVQSWKGHGDVNQVMHDTACLVVKLELLSSTEATKGHILATSLQQAGIVWTNNAEFNAYLQSFKNKLKVVIAHKLCL